LYLNRAEMSEFKRDPIKKQKPRTTKLTVWGRADTKNVLERERERAAAAGQGEGAMRPLKS